MTVFGAADLCTADQEAVRAMHRANEASKQAEAARIQRESAEQAQAR